MLVNYQMTLISDNRIIECINFKGYDDFSAGHKAKRVFNTGNFDVVDLYRGSKRVKLYK